MKVLDGDRDARSLEVADGLKLRVWLQNRIRAEEIEVQTANKQIGDLDNMLRSVEKVHQLGIKPVIRDMRIEGGVDGQRAAFSREWIEKILAPSALDGLNAEARAIVYLVANDGYRPAEVANLLPHRIVLDHPVPHLQVRPDLRRLKTPWSERDIPLVGLSLWTMQQFPEGFPRYRNKEDALSAVVNKYLGQHDLLPTERHSLYSLRHSFEDRMIAVDTPERMKITLMGHKYDRPRYGDGPSLEQKQRLLRQISFMPPGHFGPAA